MQFHRVEPHLHAITVGACWNLAVGRKQRQLAVPTAAFIKGFDQVAPRLELAVIDLAEIQHLPLDHLATGAALVLDDIPIAMLFAVFEASIVSQEHDADDARLIRVTEKRCKVYTTRNLRLAAVDPTRVFRLARPEKPCCPQRVGKVGLSAGIVHSRLLESRWQAGAVRAL